MVRHGITSDDDNDVFVAIERASRAYSLLISHQIRVKCAKLTNGAMHLCFLVMLTTWQPTPARYSRDETPSAFACCDESKSVAAFLTIDNEQHCNVRLPITTHGSCTASSAIYVKVTMQRQLSSSELIFDLLCIHVIINRHSFDFISFYSFCRILFY